MFDNDLEYNRSLHFFLLRFVEDLVLSILVSDEHIPCNTHLVFLVIILRLFLLTDYYGILIRHFYADTFPLD